MFSRFAARPKCCSSATARNIHNCRISRKSIVLLMADSLGQTPGVVPKIVSPRYQTRNLHISRPERGLSHFTTEPGVMNTSSFLDRLASLDTNTVSDALDFLGLPGATFGLRPLWDCPKIVGRASTILLGPKRDA